MTTRVVDVFDGAGAKLFSYSIALENEDCLDAEFEEVALIFAETSGLVAKEDLSCLRAACDLSAIAPEAPAAPAEPKRTRRTRGTVVSLVKHRMKRGAAKPTGLDTRRSLLRG